MVACGCLADEGEREREIITDASSGPADRLPRITPSYTPLLIK